VKQPEAADGHAGGQSSGEGKNGLHDEFSGLQADFLPETFGLGCHFGRAWRLSHCRPPRNPHQIQNGTVSAKPINGTAVQASISGSFGHNHGNDYEHDAE